MPSNGVANAVKVEATGAGRTTLTAGASHIMEARGTLGMRLQISTGILVPYFSPRRMCKLTEPNAANHQIYQHERVDDVAQWGDAVKFPA